MQTFLPYADFKASLHCLDNKRLGKQRVEAFQILKALTLKDYGWKNHPATLMWKGHEEALKLYMNTAIEEWKSRGFNNTMQIVSTDNIIMPCWIGLETFHSAHRSNLIRKDPIFYGRYGWKEGPEQSYIWPSKLQWRNK